MQKVCIAVETSLTILKYQGIKNNRVGKCFNQVENSWCKVTSVWLKFSGGRQGWWHIQTPLPPTNNFCLHPPPVLRCFWKDPLMTPTTPIQASFTADPLPIHHPSPPKNFDDTPMFTPNHVKYVSQAKMMIFSLLLSTMQPLSHVHVWTNFQNFICQ